MTESFSFVVQLRELLGPKPNHPWGALLPQVLLWCFRRFCVDKLISMSHLGPLTEQVWSDHLELIHRYSPKGLDTISNDWFTPENIEHVHSPLEEWDRFFLDCLVAIDEALQRDDEEAQDRISEFLDEELSVVVRDWLEEEFRPFRIFPRTEADDDVFTDAQCTALVQALMAYAQEHPTEEVLVEPLAPSYSCEEPEGSSRVVAPAEAPPAMPPAAPTEAPPATEAPAQLPSMTSAIRHRRRTLCLRPRDRSTRGKTKKLEHRA